MAETLTTNGTTTTRRPRPPVILGTTGLKQWGGVLQEEWLPALQGWRGFQAYREMSQNDPIIGASLLAIGLLVRQVTWTVMPCDDTPEAQQAADWVKDALLTDLAGGWDSLLQEILSMNWAGWAYHEVIYKRRQGWTADPWTRSRYADGQWGWHSLPIRAQETLDHWDIDADTTQIRGMVQRDPVTGGLYTIPMAKAALFRPLAHKGSPEGRSLLRSVYRPWYLARRIEELQGIGIERDLAGLPVMYVPGEIMSPTASADDQAAFAAYKKIVTNIRRGEQEGVVLPLQYDPTTQKELYRLELLSSGGTRQFDTTKILEFYNREKAIALLTDVLLLGHERVGSFALASSKTNLLALGVGALCWSIAEVFSEQLFPPLWALNGWPIETMPRLEPGDVETVDLDELGNFIVRYSQAGLDLSDLENEVRRRAGWPAKEETVL
jgi:hypothetical protein